MTLRTVNNTLFNQFPSTITSFLPLVFLLITITIFILFKITLIFILYIRYQNI